MNSYEIDNVVTTRAVFTDSALDFVDPAVVTVIVTDPNDVETHYVYGADMQVVKDDVGKYHLALLRDVAGVWTDRWKCSGDMFASKSQCFEITEGCST